MMEQKRANQADHEYWILSYVLLIQQCPPQILNAVVAHAQTDVALYG